MFYAATKLYLSISGSRLRLHQHRRYTNLGPTDVCSVFRHVRKIGKLMVRSEDGSTAEGVRRTAELFHNIDGLLLGFNREGPVDIEEIFVSMAFFTNPAEADAVFRSLLRLKCTRGVKLGCYPQEKAVGVRGYLALIEILGAVESRRDAPGTGC